MAARASSSTLTRNAIAGATGRTADADAAAVLLEPGATLAPTYRRAARRPRGRATSPSSPTCDTKDWRRPGRRRDRRRAATPAPGAGAVVMMHDGGGDRSQTVAALDAAAPALTGAGYRFTTVSEGARPAAADAGRRRPASRLRGHALRCAQTAPARWLAGAMALAARASALVLGVLRLVVQVVAPGVHAAPGRRRAPRGRCGTSARCRSIVPAYNEAANIAATVRSLLASDYP